MTPFDKLNLNSNLIEALKNEGITEPTSIQEKVIPAILLNKDVIGESQTGTGKTFAYLLPIFQKIDVTKKEMQVIILAPTHELVMQINNVIKMLSNNSDIPVNSAAIIGEVNIKRQIEKLKEKPHIIVGSTGRILELIKMKKISAHTIKTIVIDEGDRLLNQNTLPLVKDVIKTTLRDRQLLVFSATINDEALEKAKSLMKEPEIVRIEDKIIVNPNIHHIYFVTEQRDKIELLRKLIASIKPERAIVFINRSEETELTSIKLKYHHIKAHAIYGNAEKEERKKALEYFRTGKIQLLIASDLAARGLDIKGVTHIFNLDLPEDSKEYLHRVGRTGRAGEYGTAISIITDREKSLIKKYEKYFGISIEPKEISRGIITDSGKHKQFANKSKNSAPNKKPTSKKFK
ncbi:DEAD/DEAH box helicase [Clostridiaceae bacterium UIB06]|uniref:DEAD/DEAH box helicase n=1 Tax=Clostridium thailandense TaxID=2794346 RepID=A0A949TP89_9CLOT|nr:DEAD/DEAH box helicase [Clostridium thailandense]MBV7276030.1 DEAD/DEAH box helicase [Clostridium thailandense]MCH5137011.1 DEAD/DEAH box helicase [Clostridiaceae bacterium UIB06]